VHLKYNHEAAYLQQLAAVLKHVEMIEVLELGFSQDSGSTNIFPPLFTPSTHFPRLQSLTVRFLEVYEHDLTSFLIRCSESLWFLTLSDVRLIPETDPPPCWIRLLKTIEKPLSLHTFKFEGELSNGRCQSWLAFFGGPRDPRSKHPCTVRALEAFMV
jgi:hypothetical protein